MIGSESAGKSSTLERLVGLAYFPRGVDMTTTCPIHLRLVNDPNASDDTPITVSSGQMHQMSVLDTAVSEAVLTMMSQSEMRRTA